MHTHDRVVFIAALLVFSNAIATASPWQATGDDSKRLRSDDESPRQVTFTEEVTPGEYIRRSAGAGSADRGRHRGVLARDAS
jgi:hypothetical protein